MEYRSIPVNKMGQLLHQDLFDLLTPSTALISVHQVNNIVGALFPVEELARIAKERVPGLVFHTDAVQAFGKIKIPRAPSSVDLISISGHKISGPKGVGALIILNQQLLLNRLRPLIWGGDQENGFRSGTPNAGLISGFHAAAARALTSQERNLNHFSRLKCHFKELLLKLNLVHSDPDLGVLRWNSPSNSIDTIVSLSAPGFPAAPFAKLLEERRCLVSIGSACHARKPEPDAVLSAMGFSTDIQNSTIRISFSEDIQLSDVETLANAINESLQLMRQLLGKSIKGRRNS